MSMFSVGEVVVCVDASDLPSPPWKPLKCGAQYVIRSVGAIPEIDGNYDKNIHKRTRYFVTLFGVVNPIHPSIGKELAYAESRFEKIESQSQRIDTYIQEAA